MIVENTERDFGGDKDIFSLAGRLTLLGGTAYAISETIDSGLKIKEPFKSRQDPMRKELSKLLTSAEKTTPIVHKNTPFQSAFFNDLSHMEEALTQYSMDDLKQQLSGGFNGDSKDLFSEIEQFKNKFESKKGASLNVSYKTHTINGVNEVSHINMEGNINGKRINFPVQPVMSNGTILKGANLQNEYIAQAVYEKGANGNPVFRGQDVASVRSYNRNLDDIVEGKLTPRKISELYDQVAMYKGKTGNAEGKLNPDVIDNFNWSAKEDPGLVRYDNIKGGVKNAGMHAQAKDMFMKDQTINRLTAVSPGDYNDGVLLRLDAPMHQGKFAFQEEAPDPKQLFKNNLHVSASGKESYNPIQKVAFLDDGEMKRFNEIAGRTGELAEDQVIVSDKAGKVITKNRSLNISSAAPSKHSEYILKKAADIAKLSPGEFSEAVSGGRGINGLSEDVQSKIRKISLDDYSKSLKADRGLAEEALKRANLDLGKAVAEGSSSDVLDPLHKKIDWRKKQYEEISELYKEEMSSSGYMGKQGDGTRDLYLKKAHKGNFIENIIQENGATNLELRGEKNLGPGDKGYSPSGEMKAIHKDVQPVEDILIQMDKEKGGLPADHEIYKKKIKGTTYAASNKSLKSGLIGRTMADVYESSKLRAARDGNKELLSLFYSFETDYKNILPDDRDKLWKQIENITGEAPADYALEKLSTGHMKEIRMSYGNNALDMGSGGRASVATRDTLNFKAMGLEHFSTDVNARREKQSVHALMDFGAAQRNLVDPKFKSTISIDDIDLKKLFPKNKLKGETTLDVLAERKKYLKSIGVEGTAVIDLGGEFGGISKVPIFSEDYYDGYIGSQIGSKGDQRKYTQLDNYTREILQEAKKTHKNPEKAAIAAKNLQLEMEKTKEALAGKAFTGKVSNSLYGLVDSAPGGLQKYSDRILRNNQVKSPYAGVAAIGDKEFIELFGKEKHDNIMAQVKKYGKISDDTKSVLNGEGIISDAWAMATRSPTEGLNHLPFNILPHGAIESPGKIPGGISVISGEGTGASFLTSTRNKVMKMLYGDYDGDSLSLVAATDEASTKELRNLALSNDENAVHFRENQRMKASSNPKGKVQPDALDMTATERRILGGEVKHQAASEIGRISTAIEEGHDVNRAAAMAANPKSFKAFSNLATAQQVFVENALKSKNQLPKEILERKIIQTMETLKNSKEDRGVRRAVLSNFFDELPLHEFGFEGDDLTRVADELRSASYDGDSMRKIEGLALEDSKRLIKEGWFKNIASKETLDAILDSSDEAIVKGSSIDDAIEMAIDEVSGKVHKESAFTKLTDSTESVKEIVFKGAKNIGKRAILPAIGIGLLGSLVSGSGSMTSDKQNQGGEYSDQQARHTGSADQRERPVLSRGRGPKYERIQMAGTSQGNVNYESLRNSSQSNVNIQDQTQTLDRFQIQDIIDKGL